jgi:2-keto-4-pentenoate hydratase
MSLAALLIEARRGGRRVGALPADLEPRDNDAAYAVQEETIRLLGAAVGGWKVGAANPSAPPIAAPLLADLVMPSPATFAASPDDFRAVEAELAVSLARDLPVRAAPYGEDEVWDAVAATHVAIELLATRYVDRSKMSAPVLLADLQNNGGLTYGPPVPGGTAVDFLGAKAVLLVDGQVAKSAVGGNPGGHPRRLLAWLANHAASRGKPLRKGQIVTTGSHTGITIAPLGARIVARFEGLGEAVLTLAAA